MTLRKLSDKEIKTINGGKCGEDCAYECGFPFKISSTILSTLENIQDIFGRAQALMLPLKWSQQKVPDIKTLITDNRLPKKQNFLKRGGSLLKGVKTISTFLNDIKLLSSEKVLKSYAKSCFSNDIRQ